MPYAMSASISGIFFPPIKTIAKAHTIFRRTLVEHLLTREQKLYEVARDYRAHTGRLTPSPWPTGPD